MHHGEDKDGEQTHVHHMFIKVVVIRILGVLRLQAFAGETQRRPRNLGDRSRK